MTNMKHKQPSERKARRQRYKNAIDPFRRKFNCTAAEVYGHVMGVLSENEALKKAREDASKSAEEQRLKHLQLCKSLRERLNVIDAQESLVLDQGELPANMVAINEVSFLASLRSQYFPAT